MLKVGLTGGIGSGKSAVSALLVSYGAHLVDADVNAREVVAPGSEGLAQVVRAFGEQLLLPDGSLNRPELGKVVFADEAKLKELNAILHPLIGQLTLDRFAAAEASGARVLLHDVALLVETGAADRYDAVVVVAATPETQLDRLVRLRGMSEVEARDRIAAQLPLADKLAAATHVLHNDGPLEELEPQVRALWEELLALA